MSYAKGARHERELMTFLQSQGFAVVRVAGSGHNSPTDLLAVRKGVVLAVECKAHATRPWIPQERVRELRQFCDLAGALGFLAWRAPREDWRFLPLASMEQATYTDEHWLPKDTLLQALQQG
ncbi:MAG: Holliday junction resolvase [Candidatus Aenigmarchaeota archaeon]|nr:Holliday junction resolvase [Candidatus Aenigmarchaeota archaeon]